MITWIIQSNFIDQTQAEIVAKYVIEDGGKVIGAKVIPFSEHLDLEEQPVNDKVIVHGSTKLTKLAIKRDWKGVFFNDKFDTVVWNANRSDMLNHDAQVATVGEVDKLLVGLSDDLPMFIRPCLDLKAFNGTLTRVGEIKQWMKSTDSGNFSFDEHTMVSVAPAKQIQAEWRWFVIDGKIVSGSIYRLRGQRLTIREEDASVIKEAQRFADVWLPASTCVMDLALTDEGVKCIEFNCFNSSGFYNHDIEAIVKAVNATRIRAPGGSFI